MKNLFFLFISFLFFISCENHKIYVKDEVTGNIIEASVAPIMFATLSMKDTSDVIPIWRSKGKLDLFLYGKRFIYNDDHWTKSDSSRFGGMDEKEIIIGKIVAIH